MDQDTGAAGPLLLQGGAEMQPGCRGMDRELLSLAGDGPLAVLLGAATPGGDHERSSERARRYYRELAPERDVLLAPHPEEDLDGCVAAVEAAGVVVLPGGSPSRLLDGLCADGRRLGDRLVQRHLEGLALSGSSAGAMVLCARTALPDRPRSGAAPVVEDGFGLVPGLALVHDRGSGDGWQDPADPGGLRWGLPEQGGLLVHGATVRAVGRGRVRLLRRGSETVVPSEPVDLTG